jgi:hypothetical protein
MPECICPVCGSPFSAPSSEFGRSQRCDVCGSEYELGIEHLARYELPAAIRVQLRDNHGEPFTKFAISVIVDYGYALPPLRPNSQGQVFVTKQMFLKAERDQMLTGIMDHKGDYSLNRFVRIRVPGQREALALSKARSSSGWPILHFEKELYGDMPSLIAAYIPSQDLTPIETTVDLAQRLDLVDLDVTIVALW